MRFGGVTSLASGQTSPRKPQDPCPAGLAEKGQRRSCPIPPKVRIRGRQRGRRVHRVLFRLRAGGRRLADDRDRSRPPWTASGKNDPIGQAGEIEKHLQGIKYRFSRSEDIVLFLRAIGEALRQHGSLENLFLAGFDGEGTDLRVPLARFTTLLRSFAVSVSRKSKLSHGFQHLIPDAGNGSALKRLLLFLRWVVRPEDGIDLGLWSGVPPSSLVIPLDTHVFRIGGYLGLTRRRSQGWAAAREITDCLKRIDPADPLRFDFPLCHLGMSGACPLRPDPEKCAACPLSDACKAHHLGGEGLSVGA